MWNPSLRLPLYCAQFIGDTKNHLTYIPGYFSRQVRILRLLFFKCLAKARLGSVLPLWCSPATLTISLLAVRVSVGQ